MAFDAAITATPLIGYLEGRQPVRLEATTIEENNMKFGMISAGAQSRAIGRQAMLWPNIGAFALEGKHVVAALSQRQTKLRNASPPHDNDGSAAR